MRFYQLNLPLIKLTLKEFPFSWSIECEQSFQKLKKKLTTALFLIIPDHTQSYEVFCNAYVRGL